MNLTKYQIEGVEKGAELLTKGQPYLIADEMGLGKSFQALSLLNDIYRKDFSSDKIGNIASRDEPEISLILCPSFLVDNWYEEIRKWDVDQSFPRFHVFPIRNTNFSVNKATQNSPHNPIIFIVGYSTFCSARIFTSFACRDIFMTIVDECHYLKNPKSQRTQAVFSKKGIFHKSKHFVALSGTPIPNRIAEIWPLFYNFTTNMNDVKHREYWPFVKHYCAAFTTKYGMNTNGASNTEELSEILKRFTIRRLKKDVIKELPPKVKQTVIIPHPESSSKQMILTEKSIFEMHKDQLLSDPSSMKKIPGLPEIRRKIGELKVPFCVEYVKNMIEENNINHVLIFANHRNVIEELQKGLKEHSPLTLSGETPAALRQTYVNQFRKIEEHKVLICNMKVGGVGFNIPECQNVIILEPSWVIGENEQAEDRCHRKGQSLTVFVRYLLFKDSVDYNIIKSLQEKNKNIEGIV